MAVTEGKVQFKYTDAGMSRQDIVYGPVSTVKTDISTDPRQQLVVPYQSGPPLKEDDMLIMALEGKTAGDFDEGSEMYIPATIRSVTTGIVRETFLELSDFTNMAGAAVAANIDYGVSMTDVLKYTVKAQEEMRLGHKFAENSRIFVELVLTS